MAAITSSFPSPFETLKLITLFAIPAHFTRLFSSKPLPDYDIEHTFINWYILNYAETVFRYFSVQ